MGHLESAFGSGLSRAQVHCQCFYSCDCMNAVNEYCNEYNMNIASIRVNRITLQLLIHLVCNANANKNVHVVT